MLMIYEAVTLSYCSKGSLLFYDPTFYKQNRLQSPENTNLFHNLTCNSHMIKSLVVTFLFKSKCLDPLVITFWFISNHILIGKLVLIILVTDLQKFFSLLPIIISLYFQYKVAKEIFWSSKQFCTSNIFSVCIIHFSTTNEIRSTMLPLRHSDSISPITPFIPLN